MNLDILSPEVEWWLPVQKPRILLSFYPEILVYGFHIQDHIIIKMAGEAPAITSLIFAEEKWESGRAERAYLPSESSKFKWFFWKSLTTFLFTSLVTP